METKNEKPKTIKTKIAGLLTSISNKIISSLGSAMARQTTDQTDLWVPYGARVRDYKTWVDEKFPSAYRFVSMIIVADNTLLPSAIQAL
ncbi:hypothetical protein KUTeg_016211 [Tegillarca granosa]|uniref:Uncharacterized protein n=1 Tax=Tegillarca granosa TaxID=220873 RepID=A0ABQ9EP24_TEGGR|nr:hypothetical protein KUTeg_016211 [Tegillarca granosa]